MSRMNAYWNIIEGMSIPEPIDKLAANVTGTHPIPVPAGPFVARFGLPSSHSYGYGCQSRPAPCDNCAALSSGMPMRYAG
jgi:hypothetical protein